MDERTRTGAGSEPKATPNMAAAGFCEMLVPLYRTTGQHMQQNNNCHIGIVFKKCESGENPFFL